MGAVTEMSRSFGKGKDIEMSIQKLKKSGIIFEPETWVVIVTRGSNQTQVLTKDNYRVSAEISNGFIFSPTYEQKISRGAIVQVIQTKEFHDERYFKFKDIHGEEFSYYVPRRNLVHIRNNLAVDILALALIIMLSMQADGFLGLSQYVWLTFLLCGALTRAFFEPLLFLKELLQLAYKRIKQCRDRNVTPLL